MSDRVMFGAALCMALTFGCDGVFGLPAIVGPGDATIEAPNDAPIDAQKCFGQDLVRLCLLAEPPVAPMVIESGTLMIDTDVSPLCLAHTSASGEDACVVGARTITIEPSGIVRATGTKPLVLVAASITIGGLLDVSSSPLAPGAGSGPVDCMWTPATLFGGGAGGSFAGVGGNGGQSNQTTGSVGGKPGPGMQPTQLQGGCRGGGGSGNPGSLGVGGGAVYLIADAIMISGTINASGTGGLGGGPANSGGGGGGSGGMIGIEASTVAVTGRVFANGGGGGEGAGSTGKGCDGASPSEPLAAAAGGEDGGAGCGAVTGGNGGLGAAGIATDGRDGGNGSTGGGGGGGGGAGVIRLVPAQAIGGAVSPTPTSP